MSDPQTSQAHQPEFNRATVLAASALGGFLVTFMASSINLALPLIGEDLKVSAVTLSWISLSYILVASAILLPAGRLADLHGRVRFFILSMIIFSAMSFASAFAPTVAVLLVFRAIHGVGLALGGATSTALIILAYPIEIRGRALGLAVACVYAGLTLGPVLGGLIAHNLGWRGLFLVVGAVSLVNVALPLWKLRGVEWQEPRSAGFDIVGSVLSGASLTAVLLGFSWLPGLVGSVLVAGGVAGMVVFLWWESRVSNPLVSIDLFRRNRVFALSNAAALVNYSATGAMVFLMSLYLQYNRRLDAQTAGFVLVGGPVLQAFFAPLVGRLVDRVQARYVAGAGMAVCVLALLGLSFLGDATPFWYVIVMICLLGVGVAFSGTPLTHAIMNSVETSHVGVASATIATMRQVGMSMSQGVATLLLAVAVGRQAIAPTDYPQVLTSVRLSFLVFTVLAVLGTAASLVGPKRRGPLT